MTYEFLLLFIIWLEVICIVQSSWIHIIWVLDVG